jgi:hypothetical protein
MSIVRSGKSSGQTHWDLHERGRRGRTAGEHQQHLGEWVGLRVEVGAPEHEGIGVLGVEWALQYALRR